MTRGFTKPFILQHALRVPGPLDHRLQAAAPLLQIHRQSSPQYLRASAATQRHHRCRSAAASSAFIAIVPWITCCEAASDLPRLRGRRRTVIIDSMMTVAALIIGGDALYIETFDFVWLARSLIFLRIELLPTLGKEPDLTVQSRTPESPASYRKES